MTFMNFHDFHELFHEFHELILELDFENLYLVITGHELVLYDFMIYFLKFTFSS